MDRHIIFIRQAVPECCVCQFFVCLIWFLNITFLGDLEANKEIR